MRLPWRRSYVVIGAGPPPVRDRPRTFTEQHQNLLATFGLVTDEPWSRTAVRACLDRLRTSTVTEAADVGVEGAWTDGPTSFCIVWFDGLIGLRRDAADALPAIEGHDWEPNMMTSGYSMVDVAVVAGRLPDPVGFGWNVADFDIGEPHEPSRGDPVDEADVRWHGNIANRLPSQP
jgi:hypothetical protein